MTIQITNQDNPNAINAQKTNEKVKKHDFPKMENHKNPTTTECKMMKNMQKTSKIKQNQKNFRLRRHRDPLRGPAAPGPLVIYIPLHHSGASSKIK